MSTLGNALGNKITDNGVTHMECRFNMAGINMKTKYIH